MRAGVLREKVRFEARAAATGDGYGNRQTAYAPVAGPFAARIRPMRGGEQVLAGRLTGVGPYEISVRDCSALAAATTAWRIVDVRDTARVFNIRDIQNPDERGRERIFLCDLGVAT